MVTRTSRDMEQAGSPRIPTMDTNIIVLTPGLTGSSLLTALIGRAGYWTGDETEKKADYDTHENVDLVQVNRALMTAAACGSDYTMVFRRSDMEAVANLRGKIDEAPFRDFIAQCERHRPWVWKDPRLWLTLPFWADLLPLDSVRWLLINRDPLQGWIATTLRRQIETYAYYNKYCQGILDAMREFLEKRQLSYLSITYEDLLLRPEETIGRLNEYLGTNLTVADLQAVSSKPLYKRPRGFFDFLKAVAIYLRNYRERYR